MAQISKIPCYFPCYQGIRLETGCSGVRPPPRSPAQRRFPRAVRIVFNVPWLGCQVAIAQSILDAGADYLLAVKDNQPTLHAEIESYFATAPAAEVEKAETIGKDHGRFELRNYSVSHQVDWYAAERSYPGAPRFPQLTTIAMVESRIERGGTIQTERRSYVAHTFGSGLCRSGARPLGD
jgi:hypothetical protein